jgi:hypothetical protein
VDGRSSIPIYRGTVRRVRDGWAKGTFRLGAELVDRLADLGAVDLPERTPEGLGDLTHARILRAVALAGIPAGYAAMGTTFDNSGVVQHASTNWARNLLDEAMVTAESEAGSDLLVDRDGAIVFRRSRWWDAVAGHTPNPRWNATRATWGNVETADPYAFEVLEPGGFGTGSDLDDVRNQVSAARVGGTAIVAADSTSQASYGLRTFQRFDLTCRYDVDVTAFANLYIDELADRSVRVDAVSAELDPRRSAASLERFMDVEIGDRHGIHWDDGHGDPMTGVFHVQGIRWNVDPDHLRLGLDLWAYSGFGLAPDVSNRWGDAKWSISVWQ